MNLQDELHALRNARRLLGADWNRRIQAATLLGEAGAVEAISDLKAVVIENKYPELVRACIHALGKIHDETTVTALGHLLEYPLDKTAEELCMGLLLQALKNGSLAASQIMTAQGETLFPALFNQASQGEVLARQTILHMGEPGINKLVEALTQPATCDLAGSLLVEFGEAAEKPLLKALDEVAEADCPTIMDVLLRASGKTREAFIERTYVDRTFALRELMFQNGEVWRPYLPVFRRPVRLDPEYAEGHYWLATVYLELKDLQNAEKHYRRVLEASNREMLPPEFVAKSHRWLAGQFLDKGDVAQARPHIQSAMEIMPNDPGVLMAAGFAAEEEPEVALPYFEKSLEYGGDEVFLCTKIFETAFDCLSHQLNMEKFDENTLTKAFDYFQKALTFGERGEPNWLDDPTNFGKLNDMRQWQQELEDIEQNWRALMYRLRGDFVGFVAQELVEVCAKMGSQSELDYAKIQKEMLVEDAIPAFLTSLDLRPDYGGAWHGMAQAYEMAEDYASARRAAELGIERAPSYWPLYFAAGDYCKKYYNDFGKAIQYYQRGLKLNPAWVIGYKVLAWCYTELGQFQTAITNLHLALQLEPDNGDFYTCLAINYLKLSQYTLAMQHLQTAVELGDPEAQMILRKLQ